MKKTSKIIIGIIIAAVLLLGVGYAAIQNVTLNIEGTATADPSQSNFKVMFSGTPKVSDDTKVVAAITNDTNATINVSGLTTKGDTVTATYTVQNASSDLSADLSVATTNSNTEYFTLKADLAKTSLIAGEATTLTVTVTLTKTPVSGQVSSTIGIQTIATPVEPGQEGKNPENINGSSQTPDTIQTLAEVTNGNIGDYIDLGNNIVGTDNTSDDWRVLYVENNTVYAILADYLPASQVPETAGLDTNTADYQYSVWSDTDKDTLLNGLLSTTAWNSFANGISGATATGSPTAELFMSSYNTKSGTNGDYTNEPVLNSDIEDYDLYVPHTSLYENCNGYWLTTPYGFSSDNMYALGSGRLHSYHNYKNTSLSARPVVALPTTTEAYLVNGVWEVLK